MSQLNSDSARTLEEHKEWSERFTQRLNSIYKELCEYDNIVNEQNQGDSLKLMELLETVEDLNTSTATIRLHDARLQRKHDDLKDQMRLLQQSVELLKLEQKS